jgi:hypothetical protein
LVFVVLFDSIFFKLKKGAEAPCENYFVAQVSTVIAAESTEVESTTTVAVSTVADSVPGVLVQATKAVAKATIAKITDFFMVLFSVINCLKKLVLTSCRGGGIRTPGTVSRTSVFKTDPFDRSGTPL